MLSLIIPTYNEEGAVEDIIRRADAVLNENDEIIVVDDGSTDATPAILKKIDIDRLHVIRHDHNKGNGAAIITGVDHAHGEWIATIDADTTYYPEDIPRLKDIAKEQNVDMIIGVRKSLMDGPFIHRTARNLLRKLAEYASGKPIDDINSGLRIVRKQIIERYRHLYPHRFSLHIVLTICASKDGYRLRYEPIRYGARIGISKLSSGLRGYWYFFRFLILIPWVATIKAPEKDKIS